MLFQPAVALTLAKSVHWKARAAERALKQPVVSSSPADLWLCSVVLSCAMCCVSLFVWYVCAGDMYLARFQVDEEPDGCEDAAAAAQASDRGSSDRQKQPSPNNTTFIS